ncbi:GTP-binding protein [Phytophthora palmivora]|uniref:Elongation factor Tu, chloroplastic n=1 Tax=Phytophthora palmivora TaxID=4796 RepID=A0A2P4YSI8_9STRA|nr:GTP-binding protein [Phytophthora palmivora]
MHWRLNEGGGTAFYELGVKDNGEVLGLTEDAMLSSLGTLARMCRVVHAEMKLSKFRAGRDARHKAVRIEVTRVLEHNATKRLRVSVIGDFESGKLTLNRELGRKNYDDGNGLARMQVCRHRHELENGCTSSVSEHTIAVAVDGHFRSTDELATCDFGDSDEDEEKQTTKRQESFITLSDLAGHKKYLKSTASGLAGQFPDYAMLVVDAVRGVRDMTAAHIKIACSHVVSFPVVITKTDRATDERIQQVLVEVADLLKAFCPYQRVVLTPKSTDTFMRGKETLTSASIVPVFQISSVDGSGLDVLQGYLAALEPKRACVAKFETPAEFQISQAYDIEEAGIIGTELVQAGTFCVGEQMLLGPDSDGHFCDVAVESIEVQRKAAQSLSAGETGAVLIRLLSTVQPAYRIRKGTMLVHPSIRPTATRQFDAELKFLDPAMATRMFRQAVSEAVQVRQMAKIVRLGNLTAGAPNAPPSTLQPATTMCRFEFMYWPEYIRPDVPLVLREGKTQAVGRVVRVVPHFHKKQRVARVSSC